MATYTKPASVTKTQQNAPARMAARVAKALAVRQQHHAARKAQRATAAYAAELAAMQAKYAALGITLPTLVKAANTTPRQPHGSGVCQQVWAIAAAQGYVRKATLAACAAAGINPATAATQYALAAKAHQAATAAA